MSSLLKFTLVSLMATLLSSGCCLTSTCLTSSCGVAGGGCGAAPSCGVAGYAEPGCGLPAGGGCDGACGGGGACAGGGCGLGLGCLGKIFNIASYGCTGCASGCGGNYYHDWISDPPCADPCDGCGNYTGIAAGGVCGSCTGSGIAPSCGAAGYEPSCGAGGYVEPSCGLAGGCDGACGGGCGVGGGGGCGIARTGFQLPGRLLYSAWGGVGGLFRELHRGLTPGGPVCNAFTSSCGGCGSCNTCVVEPGFVDPACGCVASTGGHAGAIAGCQSCNVQTVAAQTPHRGGGLAGNGRIPHAVTRQIRTAHNRPPHKVLSNRLR